MERGRGATKSVSVAARGGGHLSGIFIYPVKSLRGCAVPAAELDELGFVDDRRFMVVDDTGRFLSQRTVRRMAQIAATLDTQALTMAADGHGRIQIPRRSDDAPLRRVSIWKSTGVLAEDCGDAGSAWLGKILGLGCRLVRIGGKFRRPILKPGVAGPGDIVNFADAFPFMAIGEGSLRDLNDRLAAQGEEPVPMDRFRPSLVIAGSAPFAEDNWPRFRIGGIIFRAGGPCGRCIVTTTDQMTGERGIEPLRTLATYRRDPTDPGNVNFGQNLIHETKRGTLRIGDLVTPM
ncbi:MAG: MOSC domain-containing protein [Opitutaceae bacterium]|nr:MOSC domain-containing protein [Opitutaceae bacterium]